MAIPSRLPRIPVGRRYLAATAAASAIIFTWVVFATRDASRLWIFGVVATIGGGAGLLGTVAPVRGTAALGALWVAVGTLLGLAIPALMTVGIVYLATGLAVAAALPWVPAPDDRAWRHPLYLGIGTAAFTVTLWALYCATIPGG